MSLLIQSLHHLHQFAEKVRVLIHERPELTAEEKWAETEKAYGELLDQIKPYRRTALLSISPEDEP